MKICLIYDFLTEYGGLERLMANHAKIKTKKEAVNLSLCYLGINKLSEINADAFLIYSFPSNYMVRKKKAIKINYINHFPHFLYFNRKDKIEWASSTHGIKRHVSVIMSWLIGGWLKKLDMNLVKGNDLRFANCDFTKKGLEKLYGSKMIKSYPVLDVVFKPSKEKINERFIF